MLIIFTHTYTSPCLTGDVYKHSMVAHCDHNTISSQTPNPSVCLDLICRETLPAGCNPRWSSEERTIRPEEDYLL